MLQYEDSKYTCLFESLTPLTRFLGVFTSVVLCGVGVDISFHHHPMGLYIIVCAVLVFFLEITWTVSLFLQVCSRGERSCLCWRWVLWFAGWKKSLLYCGIAAALIAWPHHLWLSTVAGGMLLLLASCYALLSLSPTHPSPGSRLLHAEDSCDRFDTDMLDDSFSASESPLRHPRTAGRTSAVILDI
ncbi:uncharacterized protein LOC132204681 [Neocloeon triangulifer]|uniref:uncharacterized protein LOC132204681 n=1 Tax=Neocloeon triangulifer TaxID=2078957 RepID=UPI00286EFEE3|nr:uncharacterized protein LOC132204681 [Neocloeon triangulifer]